MYHISYSTSKGNSSLKCTAEEVAGVLRSIVLFALAGYELSNFTITRL